MRSIAGKPPLHLPEYRPAEYDCLNQKLKTYYARKRKLFEDTYPDFYDADLRELFFSHTMGRDESRRPFICGGGDGVCLIPSANGRTKENSGSTNCSRA